MDLVPWFVPLGVSLGLGQAKRLGFKTGLLKSGKPHF